MHGRLAPERTGFEPSLQLGVALCGPVAAAGQVVPDRHVVTIAGADGVGGQPERHPRHTLDGRTERLYARPGLVGGVGRIEAVVVGRCLRQARDVRRERSALLTEEIRHTPARSGCARIAAPVEKRHGRRQPVGQADGAVHRRRARRNARRGGRRNHEFVGGEVVIVHRLVRSRNPVRRPAPVRNADLVDSAAEVVCAVTVVGPHVEPSVPRIPRSLRIGSDQDAVGVHAACSPVPDDRQVTPVTGCQRVPGSQHGVHAGDIVARAEQAVRGGAIDVYVLVVPARGVGDNARVVVPSSVPAHQGFVGQRARQIQRGAVIEVHVVVSAVEQVAAARPPGDPLVDPRNDCAVHIIDGGILNRAGAFGEMPHGLEPAVPYLRGLPGQRARRRNGTPPVSPDLRRVGQLWHPHPYGTRTVRVPLFDLMDKGVGAGGIREAQVRSRGRREPIVVHSL